MADNDFVALENRFWQTMQDRDLEGALALMDDTCVLTGAQGVSQIDKAVFAKLMTTGTWTLHSFAITDVQVKRIATDVAVVGYKVHEVLTVDGKQIELNAADASTWVRRSGQWLCALHTESVLGDPFGRDKQSS